MGKAPIHRQIADDLRAAIARGDLRPGDALPSEHELMARYGVARGTVRQARAALLADGVIGGSQGRRFEVQAGVLTQPISSLLSFSAWADGLGRRPRGQVVSLEERPASSDEVARLGLAAGDEVVDLVRLRLLDDEPVMIERTLFTPAAGRIVAGLDLAGGSIYDGLAAAGIAVTAARQSISAMPAGRIDARLLRVAERSALLRIRRLGYDARGAPVEWSDDRYPAGKVEFAIDSVAMASGVSRRLEA
jgi:GntR family transcriptional regulator